MPERNNVLWFSIFEHGERLSVKIGHNTLLVVDHRGVDQDFVDILANDEGSGIVGGWLLARCGTRRRSRAGLGLRRLRRDWLGLNWLGLGWLGLSGLGLDTLRLKLPLPRRVPGEGLCQYRDRGADPDRTL